MPNIFDQFDAASAVASAPSAGENAFDRFEKPDDTDKAKPTSPEPEKNFLQRAEDAVQTVNDLRKGIEQGLTFGFADEILAGALTPFEAARSYFTGKDEGMGFGERLYAAYSRLIEKERGGLKEAQE